MTRQVRLDDDVAAFVESRSGGLSLSGSTNAILRLVAGDQGDHDQDGARSPRIVPGESGPAVASIDHPSTSRSPDATTDALVEADSPEVSARIDPGEPDHLDASIDQARRPDAPEATRARRARRDRHRAICTHPLALRVGLRCGVCGASFRR